jgi:hypothetical protein
MNEADKAYMERKMQKDWEYDEPEPNWEYDEPEPSDYAQFVQQVKGLIVWAIIMFGVYMLVTAVLK